MKKTALIIMLLTVITKILGFTRDITLSFFYGASSISDVYLVSLTIPTLIFEFIGIGITTSYIPIYSIIENQGNDKYANSFTSNVINCIMIFCTVIVIISLMYTMPIVKVFAPGFERETLSMAVNFTRIAVVGVYFSGLVFMFNSFLQLKDNFVIPALIGIPLNILIMMSIIVGAKFNTIFLPVGTVVAMGFQMALLLPFVNKKGYRYNFALDIYDKNLKKMITLSLPVIVGMCINQINVLVDKVFASSIVNGGISALTYSNKLILFIQGVFVISVATAIYPKISRMVAENNMSGLKESFIKAIGYINLLIIPAAIGSMIFAEPIVRFLFGRGAFTEHAISITSSTLFFYSIGMVAFSSREILSRVFYSLQDVKIPTINAFISFAINIILNMVLSNMFGIGGLALATSISAILCTILLFFSLRKKIGYLSIKRILSTFGKAALSSVIMGISARSLYNMIIINNGLGFSLVLSIIFGAVVYFIMIYFMKIEETKEVLVLLKKKLKNIYICSVKHKKVLYKDKTSD